MSHLLTPPTSLKHPESLLNSRRRYPQMRRFQLVSRQRPYPEFSYIESTSSEFPGETKSHYWTEVTTHEKEQENMDCSFLNILWTIKQAWKVLNKITGFEFAIIPPIGLSPNDVVGHWIELSRGIVPFSYVSVNGRIVEEIAESPDIPMNIKKGTLTAVLLMTEYVHSILKHLEANNAQGLKTILSELFTLLQKLWRNLVFVKSSTSQQIVENFSKLEDLTVKLFDCSLTNGSVSKSTLTVTETDLLCRILGLDPEFADIVIDIDHMLVLHKSPKYYFACAFEENAIAIDGPSENLAAALHLLGLSIEKSQEIADSINSKFHQMYSPIYWAKEYLEDMFLTHPLLDMMPYVDNYPEQPMEQWFTAQADPIIRGKKRMPKFNYQVIMFTSDDPKHFVTSGALREKFDLTDHQLLFHGAKHANSAHNIVGGGIYVNYGAAQLDFSSRHGFYLSDEFNYSKEWSLGRYNRHSAVIIFRVPNHLLAVENNAALDLSTDTALWSAVITYNRTDEDVDTHVPDSVKSGELKFIKGPVCQNGFEIESGQRNVPTIYKMDSLEVMQYCIFDQPLADEITSFIVGIVFYNQPDKM